MKKLLTVAVRCAGFVVMMLSTAVFGENIYIAQTAQGGNTGADVANAHAVTWFNTAANWGAGTGKISPGDTARLVGIFTSGLTIQASGTAGSPITVLFEADAKFSAPTWTNGSAIISASNKNYIIIDGGVNGVVEATQNGIANTARYTWPSLDSGQTIPAGMAYPNQNSFTGVQFSGSNYCEIKNLTISGMYRRLQNTDSNQGYGTGITTPTCSHLSIHDNIISDAYYGIYDYSNAMGVVGGDIYRNTVRKTSTGIVVALGNSNNSYDSVQVHDNVITECQYWDGLIIGGGWFHNDGIHVWGRPDTQDSITHLRIYNNIIGPDLGTHVTGWIYVEANIVAPLIYNNVLVGCATSTNPNGFICNGGHNGTKVYNNTIIGGGGGIGLYFGNNLQTGNEVLNNIIINVTLAIAYVDQATIDKSDYNCFYQANGNYQFGAGGNINWVNSTSWKSHGYETNSLFINPSLDANYRPDQAADPVVDHGTNQMSAIFNTDINGVARPQGTAWDIGAYEYSTIGIRDIGLQTGHTIQPLMQNPVQSLEVLRAQAGPQRAIYDLRGNMVDHKTSGLGGIYLVKDKKTGAVMRAMVVR